MSDIAGIAPLTPVQGGMLFHTLREPGSGTYVVQYTCRLNGPLQADRLRDAWVATVARHPALRTAFLFEGLDEPLQVVRSDFALPWQEADWSDKADPIAGLHDLLEADRKRGFNLARAPLLRIVLIQLDEDDHLMVWTYHHAIADGWSSILVLDEVWSRYRYPEMSYDPAPTFGDFANWLAQQPTDAAESYWRTRLHGSALPTTLTLPRPTNSTPEHGRVTMGLAEVETKRLHAFAREQRLTLNTLVHGAWSLVFASFSGQPDVVYGVTLAGRPPSFPDVESTVGPFINTLPMRTQTGGGIPLGEWLQELQGALLELRDHELSSLQHVAESAGVQAPELFESLLVFENAPPSEIEAPLGVLAPTVADERYFDQSSYPVAVLVHPKDTLELHLVFRMDYLDEASGGRILDRFAEVLTSIPDHVHHDAGALVGPDKGSGEALLGPLARGTVQKDPAPGTGQSAVRDVLVEILEQMDQVPDNDAIVIPGDTWSYRTLAERSGAVARQLAGTVGTGGRVGILAPKSPEFISGMLATLAVDAAYVPLDPGDPDERLRSMIESAGIRTVLTHGVDAERLRALGLKPSDAIPLGVDVGDNPADLGLADVLAMGEPSQDSEAYIIFTSGSTGTPKGVRVSRSNLAHSTASRSLVYGETPPRFLVLSPVGFDSAVAGLIWPLTVGGAVVLMPSEVERDPRALGQAIHRHDVSMLLCVPSLYRLILTDANGGDLAGLETAIVAGEACPPGLVEEHMERLPNAALFNEYGPTECTVWSTVARLERNGAGVSPPIGRPIPGAYVRVLDKAGRLTPVGVAGELCVGGPGVALGYLAQPEEDGSFIRDPYGGPGQRLYRTGDLVRMSNDGVLEFLGRLDGQLKIRGFRIEPREIEAALMAMTTVREAVVVKQGHRDSGVELLVAYYASMDGSALPVELLRMTLDAKLPKHMIPHRFVSVAAIPRTPRGKVDRQALREESPKTTAPGGQGSREPGETAGETELSPVAVEMAQLWSVVLGPSNFKPTDSFFEVGGDSLLAIRLLGRIREAWDTSLTMAVIFDNPTLAGMASTIETVRWAREKSDGSPADEPFEELEF